MDIKDFSKYIEGKPFDELLHHIRRENLERTAESNFSAERLLQVSSQQDVKTAMNQ